MKQGIHDVITDGGVWILKNMRIGDQSLITGRGELQNGKITGPKLFAPPTPSPQDRVKVFAPLPASLKVW